MTAEHRDQTGEQPDRSRERRDHEADRRDEAAERRDEAAERHNLASADTIDRSAQARLYPADRKGPSRQRGAVASDRTQAEQDRGAPLSDRGVDAKDHATVDDLRGVYLRDEGLLALEREIARLVRERQPLVLAFVEVEHLQAINDSRGQTAGDRILLDVASTLRTNLRSYDLIIRYGEDAFICAIPGMALAEAPKCFGFIKTALEEAPGHGSVTIGFAELLPDDSAEVLVTRADTARHRERQ